MKTLLTVTGFVALIILVVVIGPLLTIWAMLHIKDVLAGSVDPYTILTWFAVIILGAFFRANVSIKKG